MVGGHFWALMHVVLWGVAGAKDVEKLHLKSCKKLLAVKQYTQNDFIYGETGRSPLQTKRYMNIIKYWLKVTLSPNHKFIKATYDLLLNDLNDFPNKTNWASQVRDTLFNLGFNEVWYNQSVGNEAIFLFTLKQINRYIYTKLER